MYNCERNWQHQIELSSVPSFVAQLHFTEQLCKFSEGSVELCSVFVPWSLWSPCGWSWNVSQLRRALNRQKSTCRRVAVSWLHHQRWAFFFVQILVIRRFPIFPPPGKVLVILKCWAKSQFEWTHVYACVRALRAQIHITSTSEDHSVGHLQLVHDVHQICAFDREPAVNYCASAWTSPCIASAQSIMGFTHCVCFCHVGRAPSCALPRNTRPRFDVKVPVELKVRAVFTCLPCLCTHCDFLPPVLCSHLHVCTSSCRRHVLHLT